MSERLNLIDNLTSKAVSYPFHNFYFELVIAYINFVIENNWVTAKEVEPYNVKLMKWNDNKRGCADGYKEENNGFKVLFFR